MTTPSPRTALPTLLLLAAVLLAGAPGATAQVPLPPAVAPAPGVITEATYLGVVEAGEVQRLTGPLFAHLGAPLIENDVAEYRLRYFTTDLDGRLAEISAQLFVPRYPDGTDAPPASLYVFGAGTTGIGAQCAPSREASYSHPVGHYRENLMAFAGRGLVAVIPDYLGFDDPDGVQLYFNATAEAHVMLDAARAVRRLFAAAPRGVALSDDVFVGGYSQGGHAAFAAADLAPVYAPELPLRGAIGYGATTDVARLLVEGPYYAPYIAVSYAQAYPAFDPAEMIAPRWLPSLRPDTQSRCVDLVQQYYPYDVHGVFHPAFAAALLGGRLEAEFPEVARLLEANRTGLAGHGLPALIVQGEDDIIARNATQTRFARALCDAGSDVLYLSYPGVRHRFTRQAGFEETVAWIRGIAGDDPPPSTCALLP